MSNNKIAIPKTQILELRQKNKRTNNMSGDTTQNGDYNVTLDQPLIVSEGDQVSIHSVFLDTETANDGLIKLEPDDVGGDTTTISAKFCYYLTNCPTANETPFNTGTQIPSKNFTQENAPPVQVAEVNTDGEIYVACIKHELDTPNDIVLVNGFALDVPKNADGTPDYPIEINNDPNCILQIPFLFEPSKGSQVSINQINIDIGKLRKHNLLNLIFNDGEVTIDPNIIEKCNGLDPQMITGNGFPVQIFQPANVQGSGHNFLTGSVTIQSSGSKSKNIPLPFGNMKPFYDADGKANGHLELLEEIITLPVPAATYTATQITDLIGREFVNINLNGDIGNETYDITNNPLLTTTANLIRRARELQAAGNADEINFVRVDGKASFRLETELEIAPNNALKAGSPNYLIGTSQFGLLYNDTANKLELNLLHESLLDLNANSAGQPQIRGYLNQAVTPPRKTGVATTPAPKKFFVNKYSGIFFTDLKPDSLWFNQLKFNRNLVVGKTNIPNIFLDNNVSMNAPVFSDSNIIPNGLVEGRNITGDGKGLDAVVIKKPNQTAQGFNQAYDIPNPFTTFPAFISTNTEDNIGIHSDGIINTGQYIAQEAEGYYQIELNLGIDQDIFGKDQTNNKIHGIVSRYYSQGSYTSSYSEGAIPYIHKGMPITINDINVRILNPDNSLARDIEDNNTIFLQIVKNN